MVRCCAPGCSNDTCDESGKDLSFFTFPKDPKICKEWIVRMGRAPRGKTSLFVPTRNDRLCSAHFEDHCFKRDFKGEFQEQGAMEQGKRRRRKELVDGAVPTIFARKPASETPSRRSSLYMQRKEEEAVREEHRQVRILA